MQFCKTTKLILFCLLLVVTGYGQTASFTVDQQDGCAPLSGVQFTNTSVGATSYFWDFDDGTGSSLPNPTHTFVNPGQYNVTLTATSGNNNDEYSLTITVFDLPSASFSTNSDTLGCVPLTVIFTDASSANGTTIVGYEWSFGDGGSNTITGDPTYTFNLAGNFDVSLIVTDGNGCKATAVHNDMIHTSELPEILFSSDPSPISACTAPLNVNILSNNSINNSADPSQPLTFTWDFGNGQTFNEATPSGVFYENEGEYDLVITATDQNGCTNTYTNTVSIANPVANFEVNDTVCTEVLFNNTSTNGDYWWDYGDGFTGNFNGHGYASEGHYDVTLTVTSGSCSDDTTISIFVEEIEALFEVDPLTSCFFPHDVSLTCLTPNAVNWDWTVGQNYHIENNIWVWNVVNFTSEEENPSFTIPDPDSLYYLDNDKSIYDIYLYTTSQHGCTDSILVYDAFFVYPPTARFMPDNPNGCVPLTVAFSDSSIENHNNLISWSWDFGDGTTQTNPDGSTVTHTFNTPGEYPVTLVVEDDMGCIDTSFIIPIYVGDVSNPNFSIDPVVSCPNEPIDFTDLTPSADSVEVWHFETDMLQMSHCLDDNNPTYSFDAYAGFHDITLTTAYNGCYSSHTISNAIEILGPIGRFDINCDCTTPFTVEVSALLSSVDRWIWDFGDGHIDSNQVNLQHTYATTGDYTITLTSINNTTGCEDFVFSREVNIRDLSATMIMDSVFCLNDSVNFSATGSNDVYEHCKYGYLWIYENEQPEHFDTPLVSHAFTVPGSQEVILVTKDINGCTDTLRQDVFINNLEAGFVTDTTFGCLPASFAFTDTSISDTTIVNWEWTFGNYGTSNEQHPTFEFPLNTSGTQNVILEITDTLGCSSTESIPYTFGTVSNNFFALNSRNLCSGDSVLMYSPTNNASYTWIITTDTISDTISGGSMQYLVFDEGGTYDISLIVSSHQGCVDTMTRSNYVFVQDIPIAGYVIDTEDQNNCAPLQLTYLDTSIGNIVTWDWDIGTGDPVISDSSITTTYLDPGVYYVSLTVSTSFGCTDSTVNNAITVAGPEADFTTNIDTICKGESIIFEITDSSDVYTYLWDFGDGTDSSHISPVEHVYDYAPTGGQTNATLIYWSNDSLCYNAISYPINIRQVYANFLRNGEYSKLDTSNCAPFEVQFTDSSTNALTWNWDFGYNNYTSSTPDNNITYDFPGLYTISLAVSNDEIGCSDTITKQILVHEDPVIYTNNDTLVCEGEAVEIIAYGANSYEWFPTTDILFSTDTSITVEATNTMDYMVVGIDSNFCDDTTFWHVDVINQISDFSFDTVIVIGQTVELNTPLNEFYNVSWVPNDWLNCDTCLNVTSVPEENMNYTIIINDSLGCFSYDFDYFIEVRPLFSLDAPTAFTPNGDNINDTFMINGWGIRELLSLRIYNRWGELLYETSDITQGWDGYYKGQLQNMETYTFEASVLWFDGQTGEKSGTFKLIK